jgi:hypothetical protein
MKTLSLAALLAVACIFGGADAFAAEPVPLIHISDLYHPPCDPDDHWDLATAFALEKQGRVRLLGVLIDYPLPPNTAGGACNAGDPAVQAVAQMNHMTGLAVPVVVGGSVPYSENVSGRASLSKTDGHGVAFLLETLRNAPAPVIISVVGSCRDLALAGREAPEVFREKCRAIYLNAGTGTFDPAKGANQEWNVLLDPAAYRSIFEIPCPIYWLPCFEDMTWAQGGDMTVARHGSFWRFTQSEILEALSPMAQNFFLYALTRNTDPRWLGYLHGKVDAAALAEQGSQARNMWCTAGYLHLAGWTVSKDGELRALGDVPAEEALYTFEPITMTLGEAGVAQWERGAQAPQRYILEVRDTAPYATHMTAALRGLLEAL